MKQKQKQIEIAKLYNELREQQQKLENLNGDFSLSNGIRDAAIENTEWRINIIRQEIDELYA
jgi:hypothetical protein